MPESRPPQTHPRIVFPLHGIRTQGVWIRSFSQLAASRGWISREDSWNFGKFSLLQFLSPWGRAAKEEWFVEKYYSEVNECRLDLEAEELPSVIAHSFGCYLVGYAMLRYEGLRFNKIVLCGSILPSDFPWDDLLERGQVRVVRNEYGVQDPWVKIVKWFVRGSGASGARGIKRDRQLPRLQQRHFVFNHAQYFVRPHMRGWLDFLDKEEPVSPAKALDVRWPKSRPPIFLYVLVVAFCALAVFGFREVNSNWRVTMTISRVVASFFSRSSPTPSPVPTLTPSPMPTATPSPMPTLSPSPRPTATTKPTPSPKAATAEEAKRIEATSKNIASATKERPWENSLGMKFVPVSRTKVLFSIWDTRVQDYEVFVKETGHPWEKPSFAQGATHPAVNVSWEDAKTFCQWLTKREHATGTLSSEQAYRLPTDEEWSVAVGLSEESGSTPQEKDGKIKDLYPWGKEWPPPKGAGNYGLKVGGYDYTSPVGNFRANEFGLYDMGGNVWQLCEDWYDTEKTKHVTRGGSWNIRMDDDYFLRASYRGNFSPANKSGFHGFRVVVVVGSASAR